MSFNYRYTVDGGHLTDEQRNFYEENGFITFPNLVRPNHLDVCEAHFRDICDGKIDAGLMTIMKDQSLKSRDGVKGEYLVNKIQDFVNDDIFFKEYASLDAIVRIVRSVVGPNITAVHSMLINKPPDAAENYSLHPLHQDMHYFPFRPADRIVASWTAMERIDESNGCLFVVPGSHLSGQLYEHKYPEGDKNKAYHQVQGFENEPRVNLIMQKGDTVFFHPLLLHGSLPNKSKGFRKAISVHYAHTNSRFVDVRGTSQQNIADEVEEMFRKKFGLRLSFNDIWKSKSRLVCGAPGRFQNFSSNL